jgi:hypothetical protein
MLHFKIYTNIQSLIHYPTLSIETKTLNSKKQLTGSNSLELS